MLQRIGKFTSRSATGVVGSVRDALRKMVELPRNIKQACLLGLDMVFVTASMWCAVAFRYGHLNFHLGPLEYACGAVTVLVSAIVFLRLGLYRAVIDRTPYTRVYRAELHGRLALGHGRFRRLPSLFRRPRGLRRQESTLQDFSRPMYRHRYGRLPTPLSRPGPHLF